VLSYIVAEAWNHGKRHFGKPQRVWKDINYILIITRWTLNSGTCFAGFIHYVVYLVRGSVPLPKRVLHRVRTCARLSNSHISFTLTSSSGYFFFFVSSNFHSIDFLRRQFLRKVWPILLAFLLFIVRRIFLSPLILCNTFSFPTWSGKLIYSILLQHHISKRSGNFWSTFRSVQVSASHSALVQM
jgi:hypothetical protein